jgi:hypothetical protein
MPSTQTARKRLALLGLLLAVTGGRAQAAGRASAHYAQPAEVLDAGGWWSSSAKHTTFCLLGVLGGEQRSATYWAQGGPAAPFTADLVQASPRPLLYGGVQRIAAGDPDPMVDAGTDFGRQLVGGPGGTHLFLLLNAGAEPFELSAITITGNARSDFLVAGTALPLVVPPASSATVAVVFRPLAEGYRSATIQLDFNAPELPGHSFAVAGIGLRAVWVSSSNDSGPGSLREAIGTANAQVGEDVIAFAPGVAGTIELQSPLPAIAESLAFAGPGPDQLVISRRLPSSPYPLLSVAPGFHGTLSLKGLLLRDGAGRAGVVALAGGDLVVEDCVFLANRVTEDLGAAVLLVSDGTTLTANRCAFLYNQDLVDLDPIAGSAIVAWRAGSVTVTDCRFQTNFSNLGAIVVDGSPTVIRRCLFEANINAGGGALRVGPLHPDQPVRVEDCVFTRQHSGKGAAIHHLGRNLRVVNSTFTANHAVHEGGAIVLGGHLTHPTLLPPDSPPGGMDFPAHAEIIHCTIVGNTSNSSTESPRHAGGIALASFADGRRSTCVLRNSVVAGNSVYAAPHAPADLQGTIDSQGWNFIGTGAEADGFIASDRVGTSTNPLNPWLSPLADFGGPLPTMTPLAGSPLVDAANGVGLGLPNDQRGFPRTVDEPVWPNVAGGDGTDIGAVEFSVPPGTAPRILVEPGDLTVDGNQPVEVVAVTYGTEPLTFEWRRDGTPVPAGSGPTLRFDRAGPSLAGGYQLVVANGFGSVTSRVAVLTVTGDFVTNLADSGPGSLRERIIAANDHPGPDTIILAADSPSSIRLQTALPNITGSLTIIGPGPELLTIERAGVGTFGAFYAPGGTAALTNMNISGLTFKNFNHDDGAVFGHYVSFAVTNCVFDSNSCGGTAGLNSVDGLSTIVVGCVFTNNGGNNGSALRFGGGTTFAILDCVFVNNTSPGSGALVTGASYYDDTVGVIQRCTFTGNTGYSGGALTINGSGSGRFHQITVRDCTFNANSASYSGGAIANGSPYLQLINCTISGNTSGGNAGGVHCGDNFSGGRVSFVNCTVTGNRCGLADANGQGGGIVAWHASPRATLRNTLVAGNLDFGPNASAPDVFGTDPASFASEGWNLIGITNGSPAFTHAADLVGSLASPRVALLSSLDDHGGPTPTHLLLSGNPAIDAANVAGLDLATDQRGRPRVADQPTVANAAGGDGSDIGAVEGSLFALPAITGQPQSVTVTKTDSTEVAPVSFRVTAPDAESYAWFHVRGGATNAVAGGASAALRLPDARRADEGAYFAVVANGSGSVTSELAALRVIIPQRLVAPEYSNKTRGHARQFNFANLHAGGGPLARLGLSQFLRLPERQAALALEEPAQALVARTAGAPNDPRGHAVARLAPGAAALKPILPTDRAALRNDRDWVFRVHARRRQRVVSTQAGYGIRAARQASGPPASPSPPDRKARRRSVCGRTVPPIRGAADRPKPERARPASLPG